jgi:hypothetical protein
MSRIHYLLLGLVLFMTAACSGTNTEQSGSEESTTQGETAAPQKKASGEKPAAPAPPQPKYVSLNAGTIIPVRLLDPLDTSVNQTGDTFRASVDDNLTVNNSIVVPRGSQVEGKLTLVQRSGRVKGVAEMSLQLDSLQVGGKSYPIQTETLSFQAETTKKQDAEKVGIGTGIGAAIGAIAGGGKGAAIGAAVGAGAGGATVAATRGKELKYEAEHQFQFKLSENVSIRIQ